MEQGGDGSILKGGVEQHVALCGTKENGDVTFDKDKADWVSGDGSLEFSLEILYVARFKRFRVSITTCPVHSEKAGFAAELEKDVG